MPLPQCTRWGRKNSASHFTWLHSGPVLRVYTTFYAFFSETLHWISLKLYQNIYPCFLLEMTGFDCCKKVLIVPFEWFLPQFFQKLDIGFLYNFTKTYTLAPSWNDGFWLLLNIHFFTDWVIFVPKMGHFSIFIRNLALHLFKTLPKHIYPCSLFKMIVFDFL